MRTGKAVRATDAAAFVLLRSRDSRIEVLLGKRHTKSTFLPEYYVFPGGKLDRADARPSSLHLAAGVARGLARGTRRTPAAFARAAIRETEEETGLRFPDALADRMDYICQAITPAALPRRYNTRFFLGVGDACDGSLRSNGELDDLAWRPVEQLAGIKLLDISRAVLAEALDRWRHARPAGDVPALRVTYRGETTRLSRVTG